MPFFFDRPIVDYADKATGLPFVRVEVPLTVLSDSGGEAERPFIFDTGCAITTVGEDVALALGLPIGGKQLTITGSTGKATGRQVSVRFRFPAEASDDDGEIDERPGLEVTSTWVVMPGSRPRLALLGFLDVHHYFCVLTRKSGMRFFRWDEVHDDDNESRD